MNNKLFKVQLKTFEASTETENAVLETINAILVHILLCVFRVSAYAVDIIEVYKLIGCVPLQKQSDGAIRSIRYWCCALNNTEDGHCPTIVKDSYC